MYGDSYISNKTPPNAYGKRWESYFRNLYDDKPTPNLLPPLLQRGTADLSKMNAPFTMDELHEAIKQIKKRKQQEWTS